MQSDQVYGQNFVRHFRADSVSQLVSSGTRRSRIVVSRLRRDTPGHGLASPPVHDFGAVYSVLLQLREQTNRELFFDDKCVHRGSYGARTTSVVNHLAKPVANLLSPFDNLIFMISQSALDEIAEENGAPPTIQLYRPPGSHLDETVWHLGSALLPALERPDEASRVYVDQALWTAATYFAVTFGGMRPFSHRPGGLAGWQLRRATEMMSGFGDDVSLRDLAFQCDLSVSYFTKAFKVSTGDPPHRWMSRQRIERSKGMLLKTDATLADIALVCGFADQSHFTRVFRSFVGVAPGTWRRNRKT